jgi:2-polyprenyl-3-methyl-5-hydroxy-6-metoxy-1,4-benzoquinol methylase
MTCLICKSKSKSFLSEKANYKYHQCGNCGTIYLHPYPKKDEVNQYYDKTFSYAETNLTKDRLKKRAADIVDKMFKMNKKGRRFLDIGVGHGYFIQEVAKHNGEYIGIEPSKKLFMSLINRDNVRNETIEKFLEGTKTKFDFINLSHVLEHVSEPVNLLMGLKNLLSEEGVLYIETPNAGSWLAKIEKQEYIYLTPPDHLNIFSISGLVRLCSKLDFAINRIETYDYPEHVIGCIRKIKKRVIPDLIRDPGDTKTLAIAVNHPPQSRSIGSYINELFGSVLARILLPLFQMNHMGAIACLYITRH